MFVLCILGMKVLKFGGTSVGSTESLRSVKKIVESRNEDLVVVVSALGGITDQLIRVSNMAAASDEAYRELCAQIRERHIGVMEELFPTPASGQQDRAQALKAEVCALLDRLSDMLQGIFLLRTLTQHTLDEIVSFGERISSRIVAHLIEGATFHDSLDIIKTQRQGGKCFPDFSLTEPLVKEHLGHGGIDVVGGFISTDGESGEITNLGRGGSDYTASIIASVLDAEILEIWTDVDGFMTADPRIITTSYVIKALSYREAMELCNFGAKVIYPPTLHPVRSKNIPILIKNTFNPEAEGTIITAQCPHTKPITGISSISGTCLLTLSANSMVGVIGVDGRIFSTLARQNINIFLICQSSSETGISIGVDESDAPRAKELLEREFAHEIAIGSINPITVEKDLATVAVVGDNMNKPGIAGKLFTILGRNSINMVACTQGADQTNISFVVHKDFLRKSLNVIHDSFFLSEYKELNVFICGIGTVGGRLIEQIAAQRERLMRERKLKINIVGIARSTKGVFTRAGIDLSNYREAVQQGIDLNADILADEVIKMNIFNSVFVDCTASEKIAAIYGRLFEHGISVVAANKIAASSDYANYRSLKDAALQRNLKYHYETNVGAGLPIIGTINDLVNSGDHIQKIEAVLSGTLNFIFNTLSADVPLSQAVRMAKEQGFSEPDPRIDLSGKDVIRKLVILSREAGYRVNQEDVKAELFIPADFFSCSMEEFWAKLPSLDADFEMRRKRLEAEGKRWRFVATMKEGECSVGLREVDSDYPMYNLDGSNNIVLLTTERYHNHPMMIKGYGAGADVTAAGVFADIMSIANI